MDEHFDRRPRSPGTREESHPQQPPRNPARHDVHDPQHRHRAHRYDEYDAYGRSRQDRSRSPPRHRRPRHGERFEEEDSFYDGRTRPGGSSRAYPDQEYAYSADMYDSDYRGPGYGDESAVRETRDGGRSGDEPRRRLSTDYSRGASVPNTRRRSRSGSAGAGYRHGRSRSASQERPLGQPSDTVILEGLPLGLTAREVRESLVDVVSTLEYPGIDIRVPAPTGDRSRVFIQFSQVEHAMVFMDKNHPELVVDLNVESGQAARRPITLYPHFARSRHYHDSRNPGADVYWSCSSCDYSNIATRSTCKMCSAPRNSASQRQSLTGETDVANVPSQILVIYPLPAATMEEDLAVSLKKLELEERAASTRHDQDGAPKLKSTAPTGDTTGLGARVGSLHRVFLVRDRLSDQSLKYGFAEFWTLDDALAALSKFQKSRSFTILGQQVKVSTIHLGVFVQQTQDMVPGTENFTFHPLFNPAIRVRYWEPSLYANPFVVTREAPGMKAQDADAENDADAKKSKKRKADGGPSSSSKKSAPMSGTMAMWQRKHVELHGGPPGSSAERPLTTQSGIHPAAVGEQAASRRSLADTSAATEIAGVEQRVPVKISLGGSGKKPLLEQTQSSAPNRSPAEGATPPAGKSSEPSPSPPVSYVDRDKVCCLLCMMKYKSLDDLDTHERSRNHRAAMDDKAKVEAALPRLTARDKRLQKRAGEEAPADEGAATPQYRDRAKERREAFNQPEKPKIPPTTGKPPNSSKAAPRPAEVEKPPPAAQSKGSAMLAKMGWTAGQGLGAKGEGRTDVIETHAYQEGVGLGAEGGNLGDAAQLAERRTTNSYAEYVNQAQEKARERYNQLG